MAIYFSLFDETFRKARLTLTKKRNTSGDTRISTLNNFKPESCATNDYLFY